MKRRKKVYEVIRRKAYHPGIIDFSMCPSLIEKYKKAEKTNMKYEDFFDFPIRRVIDIYDDVDIERYKKYYNFSYKKDSVIDKYGILNEKGSKAAVHMTRMHHPLKGDISVKDINSYMLPKRNEKKVEDLKKSILQLKKKDYFTIIGMECTIWERAWYTRSMEDIMMDMVDEDERAYCLLDKITNYMREKACFYVSQGVDAVFFGDDIGGQETILMSTDMYRHYIKPRLKSIIDAIRKINPQIIVFYHSCGFITPFIKDLIEIGVDVLNPIQPECMDFKEIHNKYGNEISFHGTIGTQTTMPFATPQKVKEVVKRNLNIAGEKGGLICAPTHLLEPEVPYENVKAYVEAVRDIRI